MDANRMCKIILDNNYFKNISFKYIKNVFKNIFIIYIGNYLKNGIQVTISFQRSTR